MNHVHTYCMCCMIVPTSPEIEYCVYCAMDITAWLFKVYTQEGATAALADLATEDVAKHEDFTYGLQGN